MKVAILGSGAYGLSLALMFHKNKCDITVWTKFEEEKRELEHNLEHKKVLPGIRLPDEFKFTTSMEDAVLNAKLILIAVPAAFVDDVSLELSKYLKKDQHVCIGSKGIERDSCLFVTDVFEKYNKTSKLAVISGPSFAIDIAKHVPIGLSVGTKNKETLALLKENLQNMRLQTNNY